MGNSGGKRKKRKGKKGEPQETVDANPTPAEPQIIEGREYKIVVLGQGGVGKTAITMRFVSGKFVTDYDPTIEDAYRKQHLIDNKNVTLELIDTAGQEEYSSGLQDKFIRSGEGFVIVYSITSRETFNHIKELREKISWTKDTENIAMIILGNKCDLEKDRQVQYTEAEQLAQKYNCPFLETSAKTATNIEEAYNQLVWEIAKMSVREASKASGGKK